MPYYRSEDSLRNRKFILSIASLLIVRFGLAIFCHGRMWITPFPTVSEHFRRRLQTAADNTTLDQVFVGGFTSRARFADDTQGIRARKPSCTVWLGRWERSRKAGREGGVCLIVLHGRFGSEGNIEQGVREEIECSDDEDERLHSMMKMRLTHKIVLSDCVFAHRGSDWGLLSVSPYYAFRYMTRSSSPCIHL